MIYTDLGHHGSWLSMAFPEGEEDHFSRLIGLIPARLRWPIRIVLRNGEQIWPDLPRDSDPRDIR